MSTSKFMPTSPPLPDPEQPLYVRWSPELCPYALEVRLDLIRALSQELEESETLGIGLTGVFVGELPTAAAPTLRLENAIYLRRSADAPSAHQLSRATARARSAGQTVAGIFRSQLHDGSSELSSLDLAMMTNEFPAGLYAFLLIDGKQPRRAAFYLAVGGDPGSEPAIPFFKFDDIVFRTVPERLAELPKQAPAAPVRKRAKRPVPWAAVASLALLIGLVCLWTFGGHIAQVFRRDENQIELTAKAAGPNLNISWDHASPVVSRAVSATLVIVDGRAQRELKLDADDLRLGRVFYERVGRKVFVVMQLEAPGVKLPAQTFNWMGD